ncbi:hypothetical protein [Liquorilactobacillus hordei]|uniref:hypothetical protein n=1 Tax=Liquorilactobacillus hordei TaxID=468911 RepID=UPI0039E8938B
MRELENRLEDLDLAEKQALTYLHILPSQYEEEDYYRMNEVLNAKEEKDREVDPLVYIQKLKK